MLQNRWYPILESKALGNKAIGIKRFGRNLVLWRDLGNQPRVLPATCPHRGASLAQGRIIAGEIECPWHGFRFDGEGHCTRIPCEGDDARIPGALSLPAGVVREQHDLIWMWLGDERKNHPEVPFFDDVEAYEGFTEASYVLPYHYTRMVETNLDIHHTPFVHGNLFPVGTRMVDFDAHVEGDRIRSSGRLVKEKALARGKTQGFPFRADLILPNLGLIQLTARIHILVCATPIDEHQTWLWFRYRQRYTRSAILGRLITWIAVHSELKIVQKQDWRIFCEMTPGTIDDVPYVFVHSDKAIALYRSLRAKDLARGRPEHDKPASRENEITGQGSVTT